MDRRTFLLHAATAALAPAALAVPPAPRSAAEPHLLQMGGYPLNAETPLELLTDYLTPVELFFVRSHWLPRMPDPKTWKLTVGSVQLGMADLRKLPRVEATCVLQCAGNGRAL